MVSGFMGSTKGVISLLFIEAVVDVWGIRQDFSQTQEHDELFINKAFLSIYSVSDTVLHTGIQRSPCPLITPGGSGQKHV